MKSFCETFRYTVIAILPIIMVLLLVGGLARAAAYDAIIHEWSQGYGGDNEWVELLVTVDDLDMRGWTLEDGEGNVFVTFEPAPDTFWQAVPRGTLIVIYDGDHRDSMLPPDDTSITDGNFTVVAPHNNTTLFEANTWSGFDDESGATDTPILRDSEGNVVHDWDQGDTLIGYHISPGAGKAVYFESNTVDDLTAISEFYSRNADDDWVTPGEPNYPDVNKAWIDGSPTSFTVESSGPNSVTVTWTEEAGEVLRPTSGYLITASANGYGAITPVNGTPIADDADLSDGEGVVNILPGVGTYEWTSVPENRIICFKLYAYANSGAQIYYKTEGVLKAFVATTAVIIQEWSQGTTAGGEWVEILVTADTDLRGWSLGDESGAFATFNNDDIWAAVPRGTLIVIYDGSNRDTMLPEDDTSVDDGNFMIVAAHNDPDLFDLDGTWSGFGDTADTDNPILRDSGGNVVHDWDQGDAPDLTGYRPGEGQAIFYGSNTVVDVTNRYNQSRRDADDDWVTPGQPNGSSPTERNGRWLNGPPTAFSAESSGPTSATLTWTEESGEVLRTNSGYLIKVSTTSFEAITDPVNGVPTLDDTDLIDGEGAINVAPGVGVYEWTSLPENRTYYFKIYAYSNAGSQIYYKTAVVREDYISTAAVIINEWSQGTAGGEWVELLIAYEADLRGWTLGDDDGPYVTFEPAPDTFWQSVPAGTLIVIYNGDDRDTMLPPDDLSLANANYTIIAPHTNTDLFDTNAWGGFDDSTVTDNPILRDSGGGVVHDWDQGNNSDFDSRRPGANQAVYYQRGDTTQVINSSSYRRRDAIHSYITPAQPVRGSNAAWVEGNPADFWVVVDGNTQLSLSWTYTPGLQRTDGYVIMAGVDAYPDAPPPDGTPPADDLDLTDGAGHVHLDVATTSYQWSGLNPDTTYYFIIYPYTDFAGVYDYKSSYDRDVATTGLGPYPPGPSSPLSTAFDPSDPAFVGWATGIVFTRGEPLGTYDGSPDDVLGNTDGYVSLGNGGIATVTFARPIRNGPGFDLAVFENTWNELAFVEVSSNGTDFFRFPSVSLMPEGPSQSSILDPTALYNFGGKYGALGSPFELDEMVGVDPLLNVDRVTHVRIVDVIGDISSPDVDHDSQGHVINERGGGATSGPPAGFDLTRVGVFYEQYPPTLADIDKTGPVNTDITFTTSDFGDAPHFSDPEGESLDMVMITSLPLSGTLIYAGSPISVSGEIIEAPDLDELVYRPPADWWGFVSFSWNGYDGAVYAEQDALGNITITAPVNEPPVLADIDKTGPANTDITFTTSDFGDAPHFSDPEGESLDRVMITSLPLSGTLIYAGNDVSVGDEIAAADLDRLVYDPPADWWGFVSFGWNGYDGALYAEQDALVNITITAPVNEPPTLADIDETGLANTDITFTTSDFGDAPHFSDPEGESLDRVMITSLPLNGTLIYNGNPVSVGDEITAANLDRLVYKPSTDWWGSVSFGWNGYDGALYAEQDALVNITITAPVNKPPTLTDIDKTGLANTDITFTTSDFGDAPYFSDPDGDNLDRVMITSLPLSGTLTYAGNPVSVNGEIAAADLNKLVYKPPLDWSGTVSFSWNGYDGALYAEQDALVIIDIAAASPPSNRLYLPIIIQNYQFVEPE